MQNTIILGTGRSGTSMITACFRKTGAYFGDQLIQSTPANPCGYYESQVINTLNNKFVFRLLYPRGTYRIRRFLYPSTHYDWRAYWAVLPYTERAARIKAEERDLIDGLVANQPFCFKDPRFSATLPTWKSYLPENTRFLVVFRCPFRTVDSMLRDAHESYDPSLTFKRSALLQTWIRTYIRLLRWAEDDQRFMLVDSDQLLAGEGRGELESFVEQELDFTQIDPNIRRSKKTVTEDNRLEAKASRLHRLLQTVSQQHLGERAGRNGVFATS
jgi:hypothetical protein